MGSWSACARQGIASTSRLSVLQHFADTQPVARTTAACFASSSRSSSSLAPSTQSKTTNSAPSTLRSKTTQKEKERSDISNRASLWDTPIPTFLASDHAVGFSSSFSDLDLTGALHSKTISLVSRCLRSVDLIAEQQKLAEEECQKTGLLDLTQDQSYLVALLRILTHIKDANSQRIHPNQLWEVYWHLLRNPDALTMRIAHSEDSDGVAPIILPCDQSTIAYEIMAKHCIKYSKGGLLRKIAKTALSYLEYHRLFRPGQLRHRGRRAGRRSRGDIPSHYQDEFVRLRALFRTLRLTQNIRMAVHRDSRGENDTQSGEEDWQRVPTDRKEVQPDDDNFSFLQLLKMRVGGLRLQRIGSRLGSKQTGMRLSRRLSASRYPQYRVSPLARSINVALARGDPRALQASHIAETLAGKRRDGRKTKAFTEVARASSKKKTRAKGTAEQTEIGRVTKGDADLALHDDGSQAKQSNRMSAEERMRGEAQLSLAALFANVERIIGAPGSSPTSLPSNNPGLRETSSIGVTKQESAVLPEDMSIGLRKWKRLVRFDQIAKQKAISTIANGSHQWMGSGLGQATTSDGQQLHEHNRQASQLRIGQRETFASIFPTWLLLAALRSGAGAGRPRKIAQTVRQYMDVLAPDREEPVALRTQRILDVLPIHARIYSVSAAHSPPNSPSLLNAILRAHLHSLGKDRWERMLVEWELYCSGADGFASAVNVASGGEPLAIKRLSGHLPCLHPDEQSVLLMLEALHKRNRRGPMARALVEECWKRWETLPSSSTIPTTASTTHEPARHRSIMLTLRTFYVILMQAKNARNAADFQQTLALLRRYVKANVEARGRRHASKAAPDKRGATPASHSDTTVAKARPTFGGDRSDEDEEKERWITLLSNAELKGLLSSHSAEEHKRLLQNISWMSTPSSLPESIATLLSVNGETIASTPLSESASE